ncbi:MAG: TatD family hydrolase [Nitrososphaera sp.]|jgi:TatD DNase family protein|uniref:TatD family hydrolase n=1 Tax=Candidatus Nitrosocaldus islandicus TaxID=2045011 RepID=UPI000CD2BEBE|nr:TatD family hydrolase [Candidatus Nitrosocaldus islandicus]
MLIDAHVHLTDDDYTGIEDTIVGMLRHLGISAVSVSMDLNTGERNLELAGKYSDVIIPFVGLHPWCINLDRKEERSDGKADHNLLEDNLDKICVFIESNISRIKGIGEIGLDRAIVKDGDEFKAQIKVFERMLSIAERYGKPVSIHSRRAVDDVIDTLSSYRIKGVLLHWFSGSKKQLAIANSKGYYVSYGPVLVYSKEKQVLLSNTARDLVLIETDGPVRYGSCFNNMMAVPSFLISVAYAVANTLGMDYDSTTSLLFENSMRYLNMHSL